MILVATVSHRCGSTLIQRLLNTSEECMIYGEDNAILPTIGNHLSTITTEANTKRSAKQSDIFMKNKNSFTANLLPHPSHYIYRYSQLLSSIYSSDKKYSGFKCIAPTGPDINLFNKLAHNPKIILMYRNMRDSFKSHQEVYGWLNREKFKSVFDRSIPVLRYSIKNRDKNIYPFKYTDINYDSINRLFDWIGIDNRSMIKETLDLKLREMNNFDKNDRQFKYLEKV
jgi:hypothetical protein